MRKPTSTNSENRRVLGAQCVVHEALSRVARRWLLAVLQQIGAGHRSYSELKRALPAITDQVLARRLQDLRDDGLAMKVHAAGESAPRYELTDSGRELMEIAEAVCRWANRNRIGHVEVVPGDSAHGANGAIG